MNNIVGIKCIAPVFDASGYGDWGRSYITALLKTGIPLTITTPSFDAKPNLGEVHSLLSPYINRQIPYNAVIAWLTPDVTVNFFKAEPKNVLKVNFTLWETTKIPREWVPLLNEYVDECWLPGGWNAEIFKTSGVIRPIKTFKYPIDISSVQLKQNYVPTLNSILPGEDTYIFYFISQWSERKNFVDLLEAYWAEFQWGEKVCLLLKTHLRHDPSDEQSLIGFINQLQRRGHYNQMPDTRLVTYLLSKEQMIELHQSCDCYVSPSRGEGLGLGILDAGLFGKPVVTNLFGEHSSYLNADNAFIYKHTLRPVVGMGTNARYRSEQFWAQPDMHEMAKQMRYCYEHREEARQRGDRLRQSLLEACNPQEIAHSIVRSLSESIRRLQGMQMSVAIPAIPGSSSLMAPFPLPGTTVKPPAVATSASAQNLPDSSPRPSVVSPAATPLMPVVPTSRIAPPTPIVPTPAILPPTPPIGQTPAVASPTPATPQAPAIAPASAVARDITAEWLTTALQYTQTGRTVEAEQLCQQILQRQPDHLAALCLMGSIAYQNNKPQEAIVYWQKSLTLTPPNAADIHSDLGLVLSEMGKVEDGIVHLQQAIALNPQHFIAHTNLGSVLRAKGNFSEALEHLRTALTLNMDYAPTHYELGLTFLRQNKLELAKIHLQKVSDMEPNDPEIYYQLGLVCKAQNKPQDAALHFQKAIAIDPDYTAARQELDNSN